MLKTTFYEMNKPELTDPSDVRDLHSNFDTIDNEMRALRLTINDLVSQINSLQNRVTALGG